MNPATPRSSIPIWSGDSLPAASDMPVLDGVEFRLIKPYEFSRDGYRFLHGVALAWHGGRLYASFGHNKGPENTATEEARGRVSTDGGRTWGPLFTIDAGPEPGCAVSHGVFLSHQGRLWAFHGAYHGTMESVHTRAYRLNERTGAWERLGIVLRGGFWPLQQPVKMADGNWIMAGIVARGDCAAGGIHPAAVAISEGDDLATWHLHEIPCEAAGTVWGESGVFLAGGPSVVNIARWGGQAAALVAFSEDYGRTWTPSRPGNLPMATSKPCTGTLSTGETYLIGTTTGDGEKGRTPLTIALTRPGERAFSRVFVIRRSVWPAGDCESHAGAALSYPYAIERDAKLYVGYSNSGGGAGRAGQGRELWNNNSAELAIIPLASMTVTRPRMPRREKVP